MYWIIERLGCVSNDRVGSHYCTVISTWNWLPLSQGRELNRFKMARCMLWRALRSLPISFLGKQPQRHSLVCHRHKVMDLVIRILPATSNHHEPVIAKTNINNWDFKTNSCLPKQLPTQHRLTHFSLGSNVWGRLWGIALRGQYHDRMHKEDDV